MRVIEIHKGLRLPLAGEPTQTIENGTKSLRFFAVTGPDYVGMKPAMLVEVGNTVKAGQPLFEDKKNPGVFYTSPAAGKVHAINRGDRRVLRSVVVDAQGAKQESVAFEKFSPQQLDSLDGAVVRKNLTASGYWAALRSRPFERIPAPGSTPNALFVTAIDTSPLSPNPIVVINERADDFVNGLKVLSRISGKKMYLCVGRGFNLPAATELPFLETVQFIGPHPAGLPGTHIHFLAPVNGKKSAWHINYQDVIAIGQLFTTGQFPTERVISLAGPMVKKPRLLRTRLGLCMKELVAGELVEGKKESRVISGSALFGRMAEGDDLCGLGRYSNQVTVIEELRKQTFWEWLYPGFSLYSVTRTLVSSLLPIGRFRLDSGVHGGQRAIFPLQQFEKVMPLDLMPVYLFRALEMGNIEQSEALGALELAEDDLALCTFVDPGKNDFGCMLRNMLTKIEKEG